MARTSIMLPMLAERAAASSLVEQAKSYAAQAVTHSQANPITAVAVALVAIGCATMLFAPSKLERDASGGTGATFNSYSKAGKMLSNKARAFVARPSVGAGARTRAALHTLLARAARSNFAPFLRHFSRTGLGARAREGERLDGGVLEALLGQDG